MTVTDLIGLRYQSEMYNEIYEKCPKAKDVFERNSENTIFYLLGRDIPSFDEDEMFTLCYISGNMITKMYKKAISDRMGVG